MSETTPKEQRGPTNLRIKFRSASLDQFIERYAADVSRGGIFIRTREPLAVGTQLRLELQLQDTTPLLSGEGTVIWIRENDPARPTVPPGMAVRFDNVSADTQPTLDKILAEKARMEEVGKVPAQPSGGMAVRRPSAVMTPLESSGRVSGPASNAPTAPVEQTSTGGWGPPAAGATGAASSSAITRETPAAAVPEAARPAAPAPSKTGFLASRMTPGAGSPPAGPFTRARQTGTRPVPVPSALFEPPTAADIDKALSALEEAPGPAPIPPIPSVPRFVGEDVSNEPTRVGDSAAAAAAAGDGEPVLEAPEPEPEAAAPEGGEPKLPATINPVEVAAPGTGAVNAPAAPEVSRRFRAASKAYPILQRRRGTGAIVAFIVLVGAAAAIVWKLRIGSSVPPRPVTVPATAVVPPPAPATPPPAAEIAPPPATPPPPVVEEKPAPTPAPAAAEKSNEEHSSHRGGHHKGHEEASSARSAARESAAAKQAAAAKSAEAKPAEAKPAEANAAEAKPAEPPPPSPVEKPAAPAKEAAAPAAEKPAEAKPAAGLLKITSSPAGAEVSIDGAPVGSTPFSSKDIDPGTPHAITLKKDGFETHERMIGSSDWSRGKGSAPPSLKVNVKLRKVAGPPPESTTNGTPAEDTGGPYIKEVNPGNP